MSHNAVLGDQLAQIAVDRMAEPTVLDVQVPQRVYRFCINDRSATEAKPVKNSPYVPPEVLKLIQAMDAPI